MQVLHFQITQDANKQNKTTLTKVEREEKGKANNYIFQQSRFEITCW